VCNFFIIIVQLTTLHEIEGFSVNLFCSVYHWRVRWNFCVKHLQPNVAFSVLWILMLLIH